MQNSPLALIAILDSAMPSLQAKYTHISKVIFNEYKRFQVTNNIFHSRLVSEAEINNLMEYNLTRGSSYMFYTCSGRILSDCLRFSHDVVRCWVTSCWPVQGYTMGTPQVAHTASAKHYSLSSLLLIILDICLYIDLILSRYINVYVCICISIL